MASTFQYYMTQKQALSFEEMEKLHSEILVDLMGDEDAKELFEELLQKATAYAAIRANWALMSRQEKMDIDSRRTSCHNSVITHFNMLARYLKNQGKDVAWRDTLGYEEDDAYNRKRIGDFACYLVFVNSINAR